MSIIGFILVLLLATHVLAGAYSAAMLEMFMSNEFPKIGTVLAAVSIGLYYIAYTCSPITISLSAK